MADAVMSRLSKILEDAPTWVPLVIRRKPGTMLTSTPHGPSSAVSGFRVQWGGLRVERSSI